jgi:autotransporter-associated beta strand protein
MTLGGSVVSAQTLTWDPDGAVADPTGGPGEWDTVNPRWRNASDGYQAWVDNGAGIATFPLAKNNLGAVIAPGNVTIPTGETRIADSLHFKNAYFLTGGTPANGGGYNITGPGTLRLMNGTSSVIMENIGNSQPQTPIAPQVISANLEAPNGLTIVSPYTTSSGVFANARTQLTLSGTNTFPSLTLGGTGNIGAFTRGNYVSINTANALPAAVDVNFARNWSEIFFASTAFSKEFTGTFNLNSTNTGTTNAAIGVGTTGMVITISGKLTGRANFYTQLGTGATNGGTGTLVLKNPDNDYTGTTFLGMNTTATTTGLLRLGINDALPTTTNVVFTSANPDASPSGGLDLAGFNQRITGLSSQAPAGSAAKSAGVINTGGTTSTLTVDGNLTGTYGYNIGVTPTDTTGFTTPPGNVSGSNNGIALALASTNKGVLTLSRISGTTYTGGTTIDGGTLLVGNTTGTGTGTGNVTVGPNGRLGGSSNVTPSGTVSLRGIVTGAVDNSGGIVPGGTGVLGRFNLSGPVTLQENSSLNFDFNYDATNSIAQSDQLGLLGTGATAFVTPGGAQSVDLNILDIGGFADGTYTLINYTDGSALETLDVGLTGPLQLHKPINGAASQALFTLDNDENGNIITLTVSGVADKLVWNGGVGGSGTWDNDSTANFTNRITSAPSVFTSPDEVLFDDTTTAGADPVEINIAAGGVAPGRVTIAGTRNYTFTETGGPITGTTDISKTGSGTVTLGTNSHTGGVAATSGRLVLTSDASLGAVPASPTQNLRLTKSANDATATTIAFANDMTIHANRTIVIGQINASGNGPIWDTGDNTVTINGNITGSTGVNLMKAGGTGTLVLRGDNSTNEGGAYIGVTTISVGTVDVAADVNLGQTVASGGGGGINISSSSLIPDSAIAPSTLKFGAAFPWAGRTISFGGNGGRIETPTGVSQTIDSPLGGASPFTKIGAGTLTLAAASNHTGAKSVTEGTLVLGHADALGTSALTVTDASVKVQPGLPKAVSANTITTTGTGKFDITNNALVIKNSTLATATSQIVQGYNNGDFLGAGITSSTAANDPNFLTAIGYAANIDAAYVTFEGVGGLDDGDVLVKYTYYGDADLTGSVDLDDFNLFLAGYQDPANVPQTWIYGDFDYTGSVDLDDFNLFLAAYQANGAPLSALAGLVGESDLSVADQQTMLSAIAAVPEPTGLALLTAAGMFAAGQRRRRSRGASSAITE